MDIDRSNGVDDEHAQQSSIPTELQMRSGTRNAQVMALVTRIEQARATNTKNFRSCDLCKQ